MPTSQCSGCLSLYGNISQQTYHEPPLATKIFLYESTTNKGLEALPKAVFFNLGSAHYSPGVNFVNILRMHFSYEHLFGSYM